MSTYITRKGTDEAKRETLARRANRRAKYTVSPLTLA